MEVRTQVDGKGMTQKGRQYYLKSGGEFLRQVFEIQGSEIQTLFRNDSIYVKNGEGEWKGQTELGSQNQTLSIIDVGPYLKNMSFKF